LALLLLIADAITDAAADTAARFSPDCWLSLDFHFRQPADYATAFRIFDTSAELAIAFA